MEQRNRPMWGQFGPSSANWMSASVRSRRWRNSSQENCYPNCRPSQNRCFRCQNYRCCHCRSYRCCRYLSHRCCRYLSHRCRHSRSRPRYLSHRRIQWQGRWLWRSANRTYCRFHHIRKAAGRHKTTRELSLRRRTASGRCLREFRSFCTRLPDHPQEDCLRCSTRRAGLSCVRSGLNSDNHYGIHVQQLSGREPECTDLLLGNAARRNEPNGGFRVWGRSISFTATEVLNAW